MKRLFITAALCWGMVTTSSAQSPAIRHPSACQAVGLECDHLVCPLGIDHPQPRLSWRMADSRTGARQTAYRLIVGTDSLEVTQGKGEEWDTRRQQSDRRLITYSGRSLRPFTRYFWRVEVWDKDGDTGLPMERLPCMKTGT